MLTSWLLYQHNYNQINLISASEAVHCYQCDSATSYVCNDISDKTVSKDLIINCDDPSYQPDFISSFATINRKDLVSYCTKTEIISDDQLIVSRNCGFTNSRAIKEDDLLSKILVNKLNIDVEDQCLRPFSSHPIRSYCTCSSSLCNGSRSIYSRITVGLVVVLVGVICFVRGIWLVMSHTRVWNWSTCFW